MDSADWLDINCDLIAEPLDKSRIGYKSAGYFVGTPDERVSRERSNLWIEIHGNGDSSIFDWLFTGLSLR